MKKNMPPSATPTSADCRLFPSAILLCHSWNADDLRVMFCLTKWSQESVVSIDKRGMGVLRHELLCEPLVNISSLFVLAL